MWDTSDTIWLKDWFYGGGINIYLNNTRYVQFLWIIYLRNIFHQINAIWTAAKIALFFYIVRLEVWPGYVTAVDEYEGGVQLCCDSSHRVLRTQTVHELMWVIIMTFCTESHCHMQPYCHRELFCMQGGDSVPEPQQLPRCGAEDHYWSFGPNEIQQQDISNWWYWLEPVTLFYILYPQRRKCKHCHVISGTLQYLLSGKYLYTEVKDARNMPSQFHV
jgi:hypothetical protein